MKGKPMLRDLQCAQTLDDAVRLVGSGGAVLAGGTDFVSLYAAGVVGNDVAVDISRVRELAAVTQGDDKIRIGAGVTLQRIEDLGDDSSSLGAIRDGAALVGSPQTRRRATLGGNACRSSPSGDTLPGLLAAGAEMVALSARGQRAVPASEFFRGPGINALRDDELLGWIDVPRRASVSAYVRHTFRRSMDLATVGIATALEESADGPRLLAAVGGAGPTPVATPAVWISGVDVPLADLVDLLHDQIQDIITPISDVRGSEWYRRKLIRPLLERSLARCLARR
ncbi:FAD binding domain-containing protein [Nocardioides cavernae]|uniref:FAD binding domain-containing protein n=1 Tax=Nocardioides cavernae TaxID=1921566 RepID=A0ABR8N7V1_9ACTN|nr:FAD binding domain-containing protein [Nocardioides cavernae]MBD3924230.1 FAD binding domain-containing protein [Nocardioides cavernae]MBM7510831.1 carbon-monoxide dehydrogenase medium subunit [Nocardioides cavernae]